MPIQRKRWRPWCIWTRTDGEEFEDAAFAAEVGHVVGPVKTQFGYHLIKVEDKKDAETSVYEDVADTIKNIILQQKRNDVYGNKIAELKEKYVEK